MLNMLIWSRLHVITRWGLLVVCLLAGCSSVQRIFGTSSQEPAMVVGNAVSSSGLWWPMLLTGFLAVIAGLANLILLRGSSRLLMIGIALAMTPPIIDALIASIAPWVALVVGLAGVIMVGAVLGRWFGRRDIGKRARQRAQYILNNGSSTVTADQTAKILTHLNDRNFDPEHEVKT